MMAPTLNPASIDVIGLLRVSTDVQDVARQRTALQRIAKRFNLRFVFIVELVGVSGTATLENEDVQKILAAIRQPGIRGLAVYALDRLFRPGRRLGQFAIVDPTNVGPGLRNPAPRRPVGPEMAVEHGPHLRRKPGADVDAVRHMPDRDLVLAASGEKAGPHRPRHLTVQARDRIRPAGW